MRPFSLDSADQFRPAGPPALRSRRWARDYNEVKEIGSSTSTTRTAEQTLAARFWAEPPVQQARGSFRRFVLDHDLDVVGAARFMAMISVTYADALIACFDAKYHYAFWRPITAIRAGDTDGNKATVGDPPGLRCSRRRRTIPSTRARTRAPAGRGTRRRRVPRDAADRLHRPEPHGPWGPPFRHRQTCRTRSATPDLGRHPLPHRRRGRDRDREADGRQVLAHHFQRSKR